MHYFESVVSRNLVADIGQYFVGRILVALSGGPDSVALLCAIDAVVRSQYTSWEVVACHVHHGLRGVEADNDLEFCQQLCQAKGIELKVVHLQKIDRASEEELRNARYKALLEQAEFVDAPYVVTAHTLSDQVETMLFRLCRGTSVSGLGGIKSRRAFGGKTLIRPMLQLVRAQVLNYLQMLGQPARDDATNTDTKYTRNFLRHDIIPALSERFSNLPFNVERLRSAVELENDFLDSLAQTEIEQMKVGSSFELKHLAALHEALAKRILAKLLQLNRVEATFERIGRCFQLITEARPGSYSLGNGLDLIVDSSFWSFRPTEDPSDQALNTLRQSMKSVEIIPPRAGVRHIVVSWLDKALRLEALILESTAVSTFPHRRAHNCLLDLSGVTGPLVFRLREDGDRIQPLGMETMVRLKQYLHANKDDQVLLHKLDPQQAQRLTPVLADSVEVLWVPGYGLSQKVKVTSTPTHRLDLVDLIPDQSSVISDIC